MPPKRKAPGARASAPPPATRRRANAPPPPAPAAAVAPPPTTAQTRKRKTHPPATRISARIRERQGCAVPTASQTASAPGGFVPAGNGAASSAVVSGAGASVSKKRKSAAPHTTKQAAKRAKTKAVPLNHDNPAHQEAPKAGRAKPAPININAPAPKQAPKVEKPNSAPTAFGARDAKRATKRLRTRSQVAYEVSAGPSTATGGPASATSEASASKHVKVKIEKKEEGDLAWDSASDDREQASKRKIKMEGKKEQKQEVVTKDWKKKASGMAAAKKGRAAAKGVN